MPIPGLLLFTVPLTVGVSPGDGDLTASGGGSITLIAPSVTSVCAGRPFTPFPCDGLSFRSRTASVTTLTLTFVPEPGTLLLLGAGLVGFAASGPRARA